MSLLDFFTRWRTASAGRTAAREKYDVIVYFDGPATKWSGKVAAIEIIARYQVSRLWVARARARQLFDALNERRCGYVILQGTHIIERIEPEREPDAEFEPATEPAQ